PETAPLASETHAMVYFVSKPPISTALVVIDPADMNRLPRSWISCACDTGRAAGPAASCDQDTSAALRVGRRRLVVQHRNLARVVDDVDRQEVDERRARNRLGDVGAVGQQPNVDVRSDHAG